MVVLFGMVFADPCLVYKSCDECTKIRGNGTSCNWCPLAGPVCTSKAIGCLDNIAINSCTCKQNNTFQNPCLVCISLGKCYWCPTQSSCNSAGTDDCSSSFHTCADNSAKNLITILFICSGAVLLLLFLICICSRWLNAHEELLRDSTVVSASSSEFIIKANEEAAASIRSKGRSNIYPNYS